jgi:hypothetical protein
MAKTSSAASYKYATPTWAEVDRTNAAPAVEAKFAFAGQIGSAFGCINVPATNGVSVRREMQQMIVLYP